MEKNDQHFMYVLKCADDTLYTGYTNNLENRLRTHNEGKGAKYTRARLPVVYVYTELFESKSEALSAEYHFKKKTRKQKLIYIEESRCKNDSNSNE